MIPDIKLLALVIYFVAISYLNAFINTEESLNSPKPYSYLTSLVRALVKMEIETVKFYFMK